MSILKRFYNFQDSEEIFEKADGRLGSIRLSSRTLIPTVGAFWAIECCRPHLSSIAVVEPIPALLVS
jgi:hypothetical protein